MHRFLKSSRAEHQQEVSSVSGEVIKAERGGNEPFWSPWTMYPRSQERRRNREVTVGYA